MDINEQFRRRLFQRVHLNKVLGLEPTKLQLFLGAMRSKPSAVILWIKKW